MGQIYDIALTKWSESSFQQYISVWFRCVWEIELSKILCRYNIFNVFGKISLKAVRLYCIILHDHICYSPMVLTFNALIIAMLYIDNCQLKKQNRL